MPGADDHDVPRLRRTARAGRRGGSGEGRCVPACWHGTRAAGRRSGRVSTSGGRALGIRLAAMTTTSPSLATPYRTHTCGELRAGDAGSTAKLAGWVHRRRDYGKLTFIDLRDRHGITQVVIDAGDAPEASEVASQLRSEFVVAFEGEVSLRQPGTENAKLPTGGVELQARSVRILNEAKTPPFYVNDPDAPIDETLRLRYRYLDIRREAMAAPPAAPQPAGPGDPRGPPRQRLRRGRDAQPDQEHARGRPRLHRPEPPPAGHGVRAAAEPAAAQAAADGRRYRPLLPDRPLLPRRGPARRPAAGVHAARPRDELRRRGNGHALRRADGDRRQPGHRARADDPRGPVPGVRLHRGDGAVRERQAGHPVRDGAVRPGAGADRGRRRTGVRVPRVRRDAGVGRARQGHHGARAWAA